MTKYILEDLVGTRHMTDMSNDGTTFDTSYFTGEDNPDGTTSLGWGSRDLYAVYGSTDVDDLQPRPGVAGFTAIIWAYVDPPNVNPGTVFPDYRLIQVNDDDVDASSSSAVAWEVSSDTGDALVFTHYGDPISAPKIVMTTGWHMYAWTCDCAAGSAPMKSYKDGVLIGTSAGSVTTKVDTSAFRYPAVGLGAHQGNSYKSLILGGDHKISHFSVFDTALSAVQLLAAYNVMTS